MVKVLMPCWNMQLLCQLRPQLCKRGGLAQKSACCRFAKGFYDSFWYWKNFSCGWKLLQIFLEYFESPWVFSWCFLTLWGQAIRVHVCWYLTDLAATHGGILEPGSAAWLGTESRAARAVNRPQTQPGVVWYITW